MTQESFEALLDWAAELKSLGALVIPQPLIAKKGDDNDSNVPDWPQIDALLKTLQSGKHDIIVLTGDVHYGRVSEVKIGSSNNKLIKVITSPMSNLSELDGIAASGPELPNRTFPFVDVPEVPKNKIKYLGKITTESQWWDLRFPKRRTTEHFMTVDFYRERRKVMMKIHAWDARNVYKTTGFPMGIKGFNIKPIALR